MGKNTSKKTDVFVTVIVPVLSATLGAAATTGVNQYFENKALVEAKAETKDLRHANDLLNQETLRLAGIKTASSRRPISHQLDYLESYIKTNKTRPHTIDILGMNGLGPIHQGKRILSDLLLSGARVRVLLLDPESDHWNARLLQEKDTLNYNAAELLATLYGLLEIQQRTSGSAQSSLEVGLYADKPDRSLIIVDRPPDRGFVMGNRYPPEKQKGKEGLEGESYIEPADTVRGQEDVGRFDERWAKATKIGLVSQPFQFSHWPYDKHKAKE